MKIRLQSDWEWVRKYLLLIDYLIPNLHQLKLISFRRSKAGQVSRTDGALTKFKKTYHINIHTTYSKIMNLCDEDTTVKPYSLIDILTTLAHELAHLQHWEHTPEHKVLECKILNKFMRQLKKDGYVSEEHELE